MKAFFQKKYKALHVSVYEDGVQVDIDKYNDLQLAELRHAIYPLIQTNPSSAVGYDVEVYECGSFWWKKRKTCIEVNCYLKTEDSITGKKPNPIPIFFAEKMCGKQFEIRPEEGAFRKWPKKVSVQFSI